MGLLLVPGIKLQLHAYTVPDWNHIINTISQCCRHIHSIDAWIFCSSAEMCALFTSVRTHTYSTRACHRRPQVWWKKFKYYVMRITLSTFIRFPCDWDLKLLFVFVVVHAAESVILYFSSWNESYSLLISDKSTYRPVILVVDYDGWYIVCGSILAR